MCKHSLWRGKTFKGFMQVIINSFLGFSSRIFLQNRDGKESSAFLAILFDGGR